MSKLAIVRAALQGNTNMQIVAVEESKHFPKPDGYWSHKVDFIVAPNRGIYTETMLQSCMESLIPGLRPTSVDRFRMWDSSMDFGKLYFDEELGTETIRHELTLTESDFLPSSVLDNGKAVYEETRKINRRTWVRLYPDRAIAMFRRQYTYSIPIADLESFKTRGRKLGLVGRLSKALIG